MVVGVVLFFGVVLVGLKRGDSMFLVEETEHGVYKVTVTGDDLVQLDEWSVKLMVSGEKILGCSIESGIDFLLDLLGK